MIKKAIITLYFITVCALSPGQDIFQFEHFNTEDGLSQNYISSILFDNQGFMWVGSMIGLNRYDGYHFKTFDNNFTNSRIINLWQDKRNYIWIETYDHYYHYFNPTTEKIVAIPDYYKTTENRINKNTCFTQHSKDEAFIGTKERGVFYLRYDSTTDEYKQKQISDKGQYSISNKNVKFIATTQDSAVWIGTQNGLNILKKESLRNGVFEFEHYLVGYTLNAFVEIENQIWLATDKKGIAIYDKTTRKFSFTNTLNQNLLPNNKVKNIYKSNDHILVSFANRGLMHYNIKRHEWHKIETLGANIEKVYFDRSNNAWITSDKFGITKFNLSTLESKTYQLTEESQKSITDQERHFFFEDHNDDLWIGLHGGGLAFYNKKTDHFFKYTNIPKDSHSLPSNIVHCITEDHSGQMWLGTGQNTGGLVKVIKHNPAFQYAIPTPTPKLITDNLVRCIYEDPYQHIWAATKSGAIHIYNQNLEKITTFNAIATDKGNIKNANIYSIYVDQQNHLWLGSKGHGLFVSKQALGPTIDSKLKFYNYTDQESSIAHNNIYSIEEDKNGHIWIGTYGNGVSVVYDKNYADLTFVSYNTSNTNITNDQVRKILCDTDSNIWIATTFGLNMLVPDSVQADHVSFHSYFKENKKENKICYNDIIDVYEDSQKKIWFGSIGGGVSFTQLPANKDAKFSTIRKKEGLSNNSIYGIAEDQFQNLWLSSGNGINKLDPDRQNIAIFRTSNGLSFNNFSESTKCQLKNGKIVFGGSDGITLIDSELLVNTQTKNHLGLTNFQLFNKDVKIGVENSPLKKSISIANNIKLKHYQSSFSIAYSALDFQDPKNTQYAYILEGFDNEWNYVGNQTKAPYTNLPKGSYTFKVKSTNRDGKWSPTIKTVNIVISPVWWDTTLAYIAYVILLLTAVFISRNVILKINNYRNQLTVEKQVNELKLRFFTNISHEIRTPLTLILAPLEDILRDNNTCKEIKGQLETMKKNTQRMLKLVNELLDFRRIQHKKMTLNISEVDLNLFTSNIYKSFLPLAKHNGITLKYSNNANDLLIWADISKIDTILYNLISNAIKYTPRGKNVNISVNYLSKTNEAMVSIRDEGIGMDNENMEDLFTRFFMLNQNENGSSGIGLSLAYELAKLHYGDIKVSSQKGLGSTFDFHIPMDNEKLLKAENVLISEHTIVTKDQMYEETYDYDNSEITPVQKKIDQACILIVEDNKDIAEYLRKSFSKSYNCLVANNGIQGLELAAKNNPDAIISDIMMPQMDGIEMTKQLKEDFALCHIPVVMMTAKTEIEDKIEGYNVGAEVYITKPLDIAHLKAVINNLINQRQLIFSKYKEDKNINTSTLNITSKDEEFLTKLIAYVEDNYTEELSVESLAEHFCVSRTVLYNKIKGLTGISPLEFMRHIRLKISKSLLENGYSVAESAFTIGYSDVKYFSKQFKLFFGYPPSKVKKDK